MKGYKVSTKQKDFLIDLFEKGEKTKRKEDPRNVCVMMRNARDERGDKIFESSEYMRKEQIASFFSRLCLKKRKGLPLRSEEEWDEDAVDVDYEEELE